MKSLGLINVKEKIPDIAVEMKYATKDNFVGKDLYGDLKQCFLRPEVVKKLVLSQKELKKLKQEYSIILYDCTRPQSAQFAMWKTVKGTKLQRYVANPKTGSVHNYGCAVDVSIVDELGKPLDMGTKFDHLGKLAQPRHEKTFLKSGKLTEKQVSNRKLLRKVMKKGGFRGIMSEWWHFNAFSIRYARKHFKMIK